MSESSAPPARRPAPLPRRPTFFPSPMKFDRLTELLPDETLANWLYPSFHPFDLDTPPQAPGPPRWYIALEPWYASVCPAFWRMLEKDDEHTAAVRETLSAYMEATEGETSPEVVEARKAVRRDWDQLVETRFEIWHRSYGLHGVRKAFLDYHKKQDKLANDEKKRLQAEKATRKLELALRATDLERGPDVDGEVEVDRSSEGDRSSSEDSQPREYDWRRSDATIIEEEALRFTFEVPMPEIPGLIWPAYISHPPGHCTATSARRRLCTRVVLDDPAPLLEKRRIPPIGFCEPIFPVRPSTSTTPNISASPLLPPGPAKESIQGVMKKNRVGGGRD